MRDAFHKLSDADLKTLISGLRSRRVAPPYSELQLTGVTPPSQAQSVVLGLTELRSQSFTPDQIVAVLELLAEDRATRSSLDSSIDLVTSGPEATQSTTRDTAVVVRELFTHARSSVLVVGYAVYQGDRVFQALADRMDKAPELAVEMYLNIPRPDNNTSPANVLVSKFSQRFRDSQWPKGSRLPEVYYDPRSVADDEPIRSSLHAKCVVVDNEKVFVSSANFTEAGQQRNIEVGLSITNPWLANRLATHFQQLRETEQMLRAF